MFTGKTGQFWLGYLDEYLDYMTQGESLEDLREHLLTQICQAGTFRQLEK